MSLDIYLYQKEKCPNCGHVIEETCVADKNITHNLAAMASEAELWLWHPEDHNIKTAGDLIPVLQKGIERLEKEPERFRKFSASNGWGTYDQFIPWLKELLVECENYPDARIDVSI